MSQKTEKHEKYMELALLQARDALSAGEFPVGCVLEYEDEIIATGKRANSSGLVNEMDHAEITALRNLLSENHQTDYSQITVYSTMEPCLMCFSTLLVNGIRKIVYSYEDAMGGGTNLPMKELTPLYRDLHPIITKGVLREKSLKLFKEFFRNPVNDYLKNSYLADYTLNL